MTATVLYTTALEPITVIDVPQWALDRMKHGEQIVFPVWEDITSFRLEPIDCFLPLRTVTVWAERFRCKGASTVMLFTDDDECALALRSDLLPGQRKAYQDQYKRGFVDGLLAALGGVDDQ